MKKKKVEVPSLSKKVSWNCSLQTQGPQFQHKVTVVGCCIAEKNTLGSFQMTKGIGQVFTYLNGVPLRKKRNNYKVKLETGKECIITVEFPLLQSITTIHVSPQMGRIIHI